MQLRNDAQTAADFVIYRGIISGPWLLLLALLAFFVDRGGRRAFRWFMRMRLPTPAEAYQQQDE